jgi:DNA topoisomerase VI subunit B
MSVSKIAISLPAELLAEVRRAVRKEGCTFSSYVARALETETKRETLEEYVADALARTGGPMTEAEREETARRLGYAPSPRSKGRPVARAKRRKSAAKSRHAA